MARCKPTSEWVVREENVPTREQWEVMVRGIMPLLRYILRPGQVRKEVSDGESDGQCVGRRDPDVRVRVPGRADAVRCGSDTHLDTALVVVA